MGVTTSKESTSATEDAIWLESDPHGTQVRPAMVIKRTLFQGNSPFQNILIFEHANLGRVLALDGIVQLTTFDEFIFHEMMVLVPFMARPPPPDGARVLILGGGDGGTLREVLKHPFVKQVVMVEIDRVVIEQCRIHLNIHGDYADPRVTLCIEDAAKWLEQQLANEVISRTCPDQLFDYILIDGPDPVGPGQELFTLTFLKNVQSLLSPHGVVVQAEGVLWDEYYEFKRPLRRWKKFFTNVQVYQAAVPSYMGGNFSFFLGTKDGARCDIPQQQAEGRYYNLDIHRAAFVLPNYVKRWVDAVLAVAIEHIFIEYDCPLDRGSFRVAPSRIPDAGYGLFSEQALPVGRLWWFTSPSNHFFIFRRQYATAIHTAVVQEDAAEVAQPSAAANGTPAARRRLADTLEGAVTLRFIEAIERFPHYSCVVDALLCSLDNTRFVNHSATPNSGMFYETAEESGGTAAQPIAQSNIATQEKCNVLGSVKPIYQCSPEKRRLLADYHSEEEDGYWEGAYIVRPVSPGDEITEDYNDYDESPPWGCIQFAEWFSAATSAGIFDDNASVEDRQRVVIESDRRRRIRHSLCPLPSIRYSVNQFIEVRRVAGSTCDQLAVFAKTPIPRETVWWTKTIDNCIEFHQGQCNTLRQSALFGTYAMGLIDAFRLFGYYSPIRDRLTLVLDDSRLVRDVAEADVVEPNSKLRRDELGVEACVALKDIGIGEEIVEDLQAYRRRRPTAWQQDLVDWLWQAPKAMTANT